VFTGASSIRRWESLVADFPGIPVLNRGFGGSEYSDLVRYASRVIIPYKPRLVVCYSGDNDINRGKSPEVVASDFRTLVEQIHEQLPQTCVAFISIKPSLSRWKLVTAMRAANELVKSFIAKDKRLVYIDVFTPMLGPDGKPRPELLLEDGLHPSAQVEVHHRTLPEVINAAENAVTSRRRPRKVRVRAICEDATVRAFDEDVRRHVDGRPVGAAPDSWRYRAVKNTDKVVLRERARSEPLRTRDLTSLCQVSGLASERRGPRPSLGRRPARTR